MYMYTITMLAYLHDKYKIYNYHHNEIPLTYLYDTYNSCKKSMNFVCLHIQKHTHTG